MLNEAHAPQSDPPQSVPVSPPSFVPSVQWSATQRCEVTLHAAVVQSVPRRHDAPTAHGVEHEPPQSTSVSLPSRTPSVHGSTYGMQRCDC